MSPLSAAIPDDFRTALSGAWPALGVLAFRAALGIALGVVLLTTAYASGQIGAALSGATHTPTLGFFHLGALLVTATLVALAQAAISTRLILTMQRRLRARLMAHLHTAPLAAITSRDTGDLLTRLDQDTDVLVGFATASLPAVGPHALMGVGALSLMFDADPLLAGIAAAGVAALLLITRLAARTLRPLAGEQAESLSQATQRARALIQFAPITKAYGGEHAANRAYNLALERVEMASRRMAIYSLSLQPVAWLLAGLGLIGLMAASANGWLGTGKSAESAVSFVGYALVLARSAGGIASFYGNYQRGSVAAARLAELLREPVEDLDASPPVELDDHTIAFANVTFAYAGGAPLLDATHFTLPAGTITALTGPNGAGKSTIGELILRFRRPTEGAIYIGGQDLQRLSVDTLRSTIGWVPQQPLILSDTVRANIAWGCPQASDTDIRAAAQLATAADFIDRLPNGYETVIGDGALSLSGGESQRLALARAVLADKPILVLDEATAMFAPDDDKRLFDQLAPWLQGRTVLVITHRAQTLERADRVLLLDGGNVEKLP